MKYRILLFTFTILFISCSRDVTTINIVRNPLIKFTVDSTGWTADSYNFLAPAKVVEYPVDTALASKLYNRYTLQATGNDEKGNSLQLILVFDAVDNNQLAGTYTPRYTATKGLHQVQIFNLTSNNLAAYSLCDTSFSFLSIKKQSVSEKLIAGSFQARLCNVRDTAKKITITDGVITDIKYK